MTLRHAHADPCAVAGCSNKSSCAQRTSCLLFENDENNLVTVVSCPVKLILAANAKQASCWIFLLSQLAPFQCLSVGSFLLSIQGRVQWSRQWANRRCRCRYYRPVQFKQIQTSRRTRLYNNKSQKERTGHYFIK